MLPQRCLARVFLFFTRQCPVQSYSNNEPLCKLASQYRNPCINLVCEFSGSASLVWLKCDDWCRVRWRQLHVVVVDRSDTRRAGSPPPLAGSTPDAGIVSKGLLGLICGRGVGCWGGWVIHKQTKDWKKRERETEEKPLKVNFEIEWKYVDADRESTKLELFCKSKNEPFEVLNVPAYCWLARCCQTN